MKKLYFLAVLLLGFSCWACQDESGDYIEQLFTDAELTSAARTCLNVAKDTAVAHLCAPTLMTESESYRISLPDDELFRAIKESLGTETDRIDTLENQLNRACEQIGDGVTASFKSEISNLTFNDPSALIEGSDDALTSYLQMKSGAALQNSVGTLLTAQMQATGATATWNQIVILYNQTASAPLSYDLNAYVLKMFLPSVYAEMAKEEKLIRTDASHRVQSNLRNVFGTLSE